MAEAEAVEKRIGREGQGRATPPGDHAERSDAAPAGARFVDLGHTVDDGMVTDTGLPAPVVGDCLSQEQSRAHHAAGTEFQIGKIEPVANTGPYVDSPFRFSAVPIKVEEVGTFPVRAYANLGT